MDGAVQGAKREPFRLVMSMRALGPRSMSYELHSASPGLKWVASSGASALLGYCWKAPLDSQGSVQILSSWCANRSTLGDVEAWMRANDNPPGHNACALHRIDQSSFEYHFFSRAEHSVFGQHIFNSYKLTSEIIEVTE